MVSTPRKPVPKKLPSGIEFTDHEALRLVTEESHRTGEPMAAIAARAIILYFNTRDLRQIPVTGSVT